MASITAPTTPENAAPPVPSMRRAFTVPPKLTGDIRSRVLTEEKEEQRAETLFAHSSARIVSFTSLSTPSRLGSSSGRGRGQLEDESMGTLPWASSTEITIAAGPLRIYRVLGTTAFLNSGETLHTIFPKSQCWCVDGESKFVLRIRLNSYYRIELPFSTSEDIEKVEEFKGVLAKLLQYEVTPCPFARGFIVPLPESPKTPIRYRPWRPKQRSQSLVAESAQGLEHTMEETAGASDGSSRRSSDSEHQSTEDAEALAGDYETTSDTMKTPTRPKGLSAGRALTAPAHLSLHTTTHPNTLTAHLETIPADAEPTSLSSSVDSFHSFCSFHSSISPLPPSPPYSDPPSPSTSDPGLKLPRTRTHTRDLSDTTIKPPPPPQRPHRQPPLQLSTFASSLSPPLPSTPALTASAASQASDPWLGPTTPSPCTSLRRRPRAPSPLPSPANLYSPTRSRLSGHHLTAAILQTTRSLLLGPPMQLVALMLNIARRIAGAGAGAYGEGAGRVPCQWDCPGGGEAEVWAEDDYGVSLRNSPGKRDLSRGGEWEID